MKPYILITLLSIIVTSCAATSPNACHVPDLNVTWWTTDNVEQKIQDKQHGKEIKTSDKEFKDFVCMRLEEDVVELFYFIQSCRACQGSTPSQNQHQQ